MERRNYTELDDIIVQFCYRCKEKKLSSEFHISNWRYCKDCCNLAQKQYYHTPKGRDIMQRSTKKYRCSFNGRQSMKKAREKYSNEMLILQRNNLSKLKGTSHV